MKKKHPPDFQSQCKIPFYKKLPNGGWIFVGPDLPGARGSTEGAEGWLDAAAGTVLR